MNRVQLVIGGIAALVVAAAVGIGLSGPGNDSQSNKFDTASVLPLDMERARSMASKLTTIASQNQAMAPNGYLQLTAVGDDSEIIAAILSDLYGQPVTEISLVLNGSAPGVGKLKPTTLASWSVEPSTDPKSPAPFRYRKKSLFVGPLSPFVAADKMDKAFLTISVVYQTSEASLGTQTLDDLKSISIGPHTGGEALVFKTDTGQQAGSFLFAFKRRPTLFAGQLLAEGTISLSGILETRLPQGGTLGDALKRPLGIFWEADDEQFEGACTVLRMALSEDAGLDVLDAATALWALTHRHALFAQNAPYKAACTDERIARGLEVLQKDLPPAGQNPKGPSVSAMNATLSRVSALARTSNPEGALEKLAVLFADSVTLIDPYGVLAGLDDEAAIEAGGLSVQPATDGALASEYLASLPIGKVACFNKGGGMMGHHRATLLSMQGDPSLWVLDLAFDPNGLIAGVALKEADKASICQAIASRTTPESQCYFSKNGPYKPIDCR